MVPPTANGSPRQTLTAGLSLPLRDEHWVLSYCLSASCSLGVGACYKTLLPSHPGSPFCPPLLLSSLPFFPLDVLIRGPDVEPGSLEPAWRVSHSTSLASVSSPVKRGAD